VASGRQQHPRVDKVSLKIFEKFVIIIVKGLFNYKYKFFSDLLKIKDKIHSIGWGITKIERRLHGQ
jgi:hypothetical protein